MPGFRIITPEQTIRRFNNWFGSFHNGRDYWNDFYASPGLEKDARWRAGAQWILSQKGKLNAPTLIELGSGSAELSADLKRAEPQRRVIAADYSLAARTSAEALAKQEGFELAHANLRRLNSIMLPHRLGVTSSFDLVANHLLEQLGEDGHEPILRLARMALRSGGTVLLTLYTQPDLRRRADPDAQKASPHAFAVQARALGLGVEYTALKPTPGERLRKPFGARLTLTETTIPRKEFDMKSFLQKVFMRGVPGTTRADVDALTERVAELERALDEQRRESARLAELLDLAEQKLTPGSQH